MNRIALVVAFVLCSSLPTVTIAQTVPLSVLDVGPVYGIKAVELDGAPGREYLVKTTNPLASIWTAVYPQHRDGLCTSMPFALSNDVSHDEIEDFNGDGVDEIMRINIAAQTVTFMPLPPCK